MPAPLKRRLLIFVLIVSLIALGFFAHWFFRGRFYESTDNAYVQVRLPVSPASSARGLSRCWWATTNTCNKASCW